ALRPLVFLYGEETPEEVMHETDELIAVCPMTGLPDFYSLRISYIPRSFVIELKSLKFYFFAYKDMPIFHEHLASKILEDFVNAVQPKSAQVLLDAAARGGIGTQVERRWEE
ncbi:MAG: preQ(1) synthase, partial [Candidatus Heimdallarchaeota archaeon]|nr:preQ(1) synthase [Candidatus Heimdallarchaeota archaeon]